MDARTQSKIVALLQSRKFWALVGALVSIGVGVQTGQLALAQAEPMIVGALAAYMVGTGIEAHGQALAQAPPPVVNVAVPPASIVGVTLLPSNATTAGHAAQSAGVTAVPSVDCAGGK